MSLFMTMKKRIFVLLFVVLVFNLSIVNAEEQQSVINKTTKDGVKTEKSWFGKVVDTIITTEKNQIFGDKVHQLSVSYYEHSGQRNIHQFVLSYARANQLFGVHGRYNGEIFYLFGKDRKLHHDYGVFGFQITQDVIIGTPMLYITGGLGASYFCGNKIGDMTAFEFIQQLSMGHRFDNGIVVEFVYRHYTNLGLADKNHPLNMLGATFKYTF